MADDGKRTEQVCVKVTERMYIDLGREAALEERTVADLIFTILRRELYGRSMRGRTMESEIQENAK
jgi:hypothetical protein